MMLLMQLLTCAFCVQVASGGCGAVLLVCHSGCAMVCVPWWLCHGGYAMVSMPWWFCHSEFAMVVVP